ncbi:MAG: cytidylate kinase-like family protein [Dehalococcoidia bacterium]|nr:cytidylate kinase-like family protein [Dehalococcoidia bacterium]
MLVVTIAREYGSGGLEIARRVADGLRIPCLDREIIRLAAQQAGVSESTAEELDERRPSFLKHMLEMMTKYGGSYPDVGVAPSFYIQSPETVKIFDSDTYRDAVEEAIRNVATYSGAVIVGRAGQVILRDQQDAMHVMIVAALGDRTKRAMEREKLDQADAEKRVKEIDKRRINYLKGNYDAEWRDPHLYSMVLNSSHLGIDGCVYAVLDAIERRTALGKDGPGVPTGRAV